MDIILDNLGRRHGKLESSSGFHKWYWSVFLECAIYNLRHFMEKPVKKKPHTMTTDEVDEAIVLWRILLRNVIERIEASVEIFEKQKGHFTFGVVSLGKYNLNSNNSVSKCIPAITFCLAYNTS